ncbi:hypothetical protein Sango_2914600 [Sesamum angolense]|uniref:Chromo domain-containing protein n=1 Tax=Sesamum angolense TaxID=2727404 RepID=A0AAE1T5U2_9LAMI|nr:hypothetical protein Sango_2914600 [Sesamum angolense]
MGQSKKNRRTDYLVHWSGESEADATWERDVTLWQFKEKLDEYWAVRESKQNTGAVRLRERADWPRSLHRWPYIRSWIPCIRGLKLCKKAVDEWSDMLNKRVTSAIEETSILTDVVDVRVDGVQAEVNLLKRVVSRDEDRAPMSKVKVPNPKPFGGARSAKELENFLWDMEMYFQVARILVAEKVSITSMYLTSDAKLWWGTRIFDDANANRDKIETWDVLKKELKDQFLPCNTSWLARESLRKLKHADLGSDGVETSGCQGSVVCDCCCGLNKEGLLSLQRDHRMRDCPKRGKLNALVAEADDDEGGSTRINRLQLVSALQERQAKQKGLMYVQVQINGKAVMAMLDSGATHTFVAD